MQPNDDRSNGSDSWYNVNPTTTTPLSNYPANAYQPRPNQDSAELYAQANKRVQKKINFYKNLTSYFIVCGSLWMLALVTGSIGSLWPIWLSGAWAVGLAFQGADAFNWGITDTQRQAMIDEEVRRIRNTRY